MKETRHITLIRIDFSPLKTKHDYKLKDTHDSIRLLKYGIENTEQLLLVCKVFATDRATLKRNVANVMWLRLEKLPNKSKTEILLYGSDLLSPDYNINRVNHNR